MALWTILAFWAGLFACTTPDTPSPAASPAEPVELRLGYFPNLTHATALVGVEKELFKGELGSGVTLETATFNAGPAAVEALLADALDASYIGPNPAVNAYVKSKGAAVRVIAGATSGGAFFVVRPEIHSAADLKGKTVASPQLGGTQDVALRAWLRSQGLSVPLTGAGDLTIAPQENAQTLETFRSGQIAGAWVPEPWATRLQIEGGGVVLVDERALWPEGRFVTTHLLVRTEYLSAHPDVVAGLIKGHLAAEDWIVAHPDEAASVANGALQKITGKPIKPEILTAAWSNLLFTHDPLASTLLKAAKDAADVGLLDLAGQDLRGLYALDPLNKALAEAGRPPVTGAP